MSSHASGMLSLLQSARKQLEDVAAQFTPSNNARSNTSGANAHFSRSSKNTAATAFISGMVSHMTASTDANTDQDVESLIPIRLDIDMDGFKLRDTFLWSQNMLEPAEAISQFATITCTDFDLPLNTIGNAIIRSVTEQVQEALEARRLIEAAGGLSIFNGICAMLRLDITVGFLQLVDTLEWDLGSSNTTSPIRFAHQYVDEVGGLSPEFSTAIAVDMIQQIQHIRRALVVAGFTRPRNGPFILHDPSIQHLLASQTTGSTTTSIFRETSKLNEYTPNIFEIDYAELERLEVSRERDVRRKRRQGRAMASAPSIHSFNSPSNAPSKHQQQPLINENGDLVVVGNSAFAHWTVVDPPKTMRTPLTYRGSLHRIMPQDATNGSSGIMDDFDSNRRRNTANQRNRNRSRKRK